MRCWLTIFCLCSASAWADLQTQPAAPEPAPTPTPTELMLQDVVTSSWKNTQENLERQMKLQKMLRSMVLKEIEFKAASVEDVVSFFGTKAKELDPEKNGVNFVLSPAVLATVKDAKITLSLKNIPLSEALRYSLIQAKLDYKVEPFAVVLVALPRAE